MTSSEGQPASFYWKQSLDHALTGSPTKANGLLRIARSIDHAEEIVPWQFDLVECLLALRDNNPSLARTHALSVSRSPQGKQLLQELVSRDNHRLPIRSAEFVSELLKVRAISLSTGVPVRRHLMTAAVVVLSGSLALVVYFLLRTTEGNIPDYNRMQGLVARVVRSDIFTHEDTGGVFPVTTNTGSASVVGQDGLLLTSRHVIKGDPTKWSHDYPSFKLVESEVHVITRDGYWKAEVIYTSQKLDVALLKIDQRFDSVFAFSTKYNPAHKVWTYGCSGAGLQLTNELNPQKMKQLIAAIVKKLEAGQHNLHDEWLEKNVENTPLNVEVFSGSISTIRPTEKGRMIQTDAAMHPGMSGGPVVDSQGRFVGLNTLKHVEEQGINMAISWESIRDDMSYIKGIPWPE